MNVDHTPKTNPTPAEIAGAEAIVELIGQGTGHAYTTVSGHTIWEPGEPTTEDLLADETAAYTEHGERAAENGWRLSIDHQHRAPLAGEGIAAAVPEGTPVLLPNAVLAWSTGQVVGYHFLVRLGTILGPLVYASAVRPCTEENLPTRYAAALAGQLSEALGQIVRNDEDDDLVTRAQRMTVEANAIATGIETGTY